MSTIPSTSTTGSESSSRGLYTVYKEDVRTHRAWRHTIGRISCLVRIPILAVAVAAQAAKTLIKAPISLIGSGLYLACNGLIKDTQSRSKTLVKLSSWTFSGVARDAIITGRLIDKTINSALCVICAPPKRYHSILSTLDSVVKNTVILGEYHTTKDRADRTREVEVQVSELFDVLVKYRPEYRSQIFECEPERFYSTTGKVMERHAAG